MDILKRLDSKHKAAHELVEWTEESLAAFQVAKQALISAPVLKFPDFSKPFVGIVDASKGFLGGCLAQLDENGIEQPVAYASTPLTDAQRRYGIIDKEGLGVVWFTKRFRKCLLSSTGNVIITDHLASGIAEPQEAKEGVYQ